VARSDLLGLQAILWSRLTYYVTTDVGGRCMRGIVFNFVCTFLCVRFEKDRFTHTAWRGGHHIYSAQKSKLHEVCVPRRDGLLSGETVIILYLHIIPFSVVLAGRLKLQ
jgi:hypothetical protein